MNMPKNLLTVILLVATTVLAGAAAPILTVTNMNSVPTLILENEFLRSEFIPAKGGGGSEFFYKTAGKSLIYPPQGELQALLQDRFVQWEGRNDLNTANYAWRIVRNDATEGAIEMWSRGMSGDMFWLTLRKTVRLRAGDAALRVTYRLENPPESQKDVKRGTWVRNLMGVASSLNTYHVQN